MMIMMMQLFPAEPVASSTEPKNFKLGFMACQVLNISPLVEVATTPKCDFKKQ
jgi:hypothetical protein